MGVPPQKGPAGSRLANAAPVTPGVTAAAFANQLSAAGCGGGTAIYVDGRPPDALGQRVCLGLATPDFFSTMRIPLRAGRLLNESDRRPDAVTVVINEAAARASWPDRDPIGGRRDRCGSRGRERAWLGGGRPFFTF